MRPTGTQALLSLVLLADVPVLVAAEASVPQALLWVVLLAAACVMAAADADKRKGVDQ